MVFKEGIVNGKKVKQTTKTNYQFGQSQPSTSDMNWSQFGCWVIARRMTCTRWAPDPAISEVYRDLIYGRK